MSNDCCMCELGFDTEVLQHARRGMAYLHEVRAALCCAILSVVARGCMQVVMCSYNSLSEDALVLVTSATTRLNLTSAAVAVWSPTAYSPPIISHQLWLMLRRSTLASSRQARLPYRSVEAEGAHPHAKSDALLLSSYGGHCLTHQHWPVKLESKARIIVCASTDPFACASIFDRLSFRGCGGPRLPSTTGGQCSPVQLISMRDSGANVDLQFDLEIGLLASVSCTFEAEGAHPRVKSAMLLSSFCEGHTTDDQRGAVWLGPVQASDANVDLQFDLEIDLLAYAS